MPTHDSFLESRWHSLTIAEQLGNIGSEVSRTATAQNTNKARFEGAVERAIELFNLTLDDPRWRRTERAREIGRAKELFCDAITGGGEYGVNLQDIQQYFDDFAILAQNRR
jgi:hypothetical protein